MRELLCLVFLDITESLFRARIPIIEYRVRDPYLINHHAGLCGSPLPILYRVCLLGAAIRKGSQHPVSHNCFDILREEIVAFAPSVSAATAGRFSEEEMLLLLTQANLHRNAALLILHRLRFPFGDQDDDAEFLSQTIIREMQYCLAMTKSRTLWAGKTSSRRCRGINGSSFYPFVGTTRYLFDLFDEDDNLSIPL
ncbi:hypothetical protein AO1008_11272 [Aspergillus oryzae 100-8]|uniref:Uncharacterized protein n=1 Tax=Aspergillus oryzae (strain 3.042) TaxID=1160506 RepID=I8IRA8_ASPO3|nr:hypothetical protein Ao3042_01548 [Aspergillus oryzae 3.042]KDE84651.1 hypothetical protein AO1008_11272 [Aspergillus oryzae 100-8]|eukprot:EIT81916.1 hypothetical protein Ao3042_01548 [Aspergillus oryzae 3.042]